MTSRGDFDPDWASPPGDTISDLLLERGIEVATFAVMLGKDEKYAERLISGSLPISSALAERLGRILGPSAEFWVKRESTYRNALIKLERGNGE